LAKSNTAQHVINTMTTYELWFRVEDYSVASNEGVNGKWVLEGLV
jgi:hypothetical protein